MKSCSHLSIIIYRLFNTFNRLVEQLNAAAILNESTSESIRGVFPIDFVPDSQLTLPSHKQCNASSCAATPVLKISIFLLYL